MQQVSIFHHAPYNGVNQQVQRVRFYLLNSKESPCNDSVLFNIPYFYIIVNIRPYSFGGKNKLLSPSRKCTNPLPAKTKRNPARFLFTIVLFCVFFLWLSGGVLLRRLFRFIYRLLVMGNFFCVSGFLANG